ncbi:MAG: hypothetical protein ACN4EP_00135 [Sediminibacterium sp.]|nr:hypothetical protein [uncultured Sediminibacterium sp.]
MSTRRLFESFDNLLDKLREGAEYEKMPPRHSSGEDAAFRVDDDALNAIDQDDFGEPKRNDLDGEEKDRNIPSVFYENQKLIQVHYPTQEQLNGLVLVGIGGANNRIITPSFHLILARYASVDFKYTRGYEKPYFYTRYKDVSSVLVVDNNIFKDEYKICTYNALVGSKSKGEPLLPHLCKLNDKPIRFVYSEDSLKSSPAAHSLGLGVKLQHTLELEAINNLELREEDTVICLKNGPYLSNSVVPSDAKEGLLKLLPWSEKRWCYIAVSNKISDSKVLINTLSRIENEHLLEQYFPDQNVLTTTIKNFGTDLLLLRKILKPGQRTPLIQYVEKTREGYFDTPAMKKLLPLTCYYHKFNKPYNFIRIEIPTFMWEENRELAELAISATIWQLELGGDMPLVLKAAAQQADNSHDRNVIDSQMKAAFEKKQLNLIEFLNIE